MKKILLLTIILISLTIKLSADNIIINESILSDTNEIDTNSTYTYDTSTSIREYRYIASNEEITEDDLKENSGKWTIIGFNEALPILTVRYFAVEVFFRYNF